MGVALIHMNGRMYDAKLGRFLSPDNFIQEPFSTQSFNRFGYVWNNPLKFTDPSGEIFWSVVIGAVIGAYLGGVQANGSYNPFEWKGNASTLLGVLGGAIIGGISGGVGAYAAAKLAPLITTAGGFLGGAVSGFIGGAVGGTIYGGFMSQLPGGDGDFWGGAAKGFIMGAVGGTILGGVIGGIRSVFQGKGFWTGKDLASKATAKTISSLKTESVHDVAPKNNLSNQKLDLKALSGNNKPVTTGSYKKIGLDGRTRINLLEESKKLKFFKSENLAIDHFNKHSKSIMKLTGRNIYNYKQYISEANHIIKNGTFLPQKNAYVKFMSGYGGKARFGYVGLDRATGSITTYHTKSLSDIVRIAPDIFSK
ncbi:RHS repeat-associated core domain-containing protein [Tenacibaculum maritimum]|uniref:RHS repeat-associated core domain-containing protein n=1 Tax=Tenacibaculum maritimum TaxID=107401 RepID=UPI001330D7F4